MTSPMTANAVPPAVTAALGGSGAELVDQVPTPLTGSTGAATAAVERLTLRIRDSAGTVRTHRVVRKTLRPLTSGRHALASRSADHWAYWRRESLAYASGVLPTGPGLSAPPVLAVEDDVVYTSEVDGAPEDPWVAARRLGRWQAATPVPNAPWLAQNQLAQRIAVTDLDWEDVDADPRLVDLWGRREEMLAELATLPSTVVHGDYSAGNLRAADADTTVAIDWATFGVGPVGADLASLTLSTGVWLLDDYLAGLGNAFTTESVRRGYQIALALTHTSRVHWALSLQRPVDPSLTELVLCRAAR
ncbi:phosphotransferase family protein [Occultella gossypii]|uniref:Phosphotransferase n=1 Tax=Occultella gossypii TaxID=2800820 RepID=A0ABS7S9P8_9MICO|nr:phosphotransferase [Occultella gossypii]MBZ2197069.1 phosphotransferase [Occultella gossypii]